jgi:phage-related baseplate assembly protein
VKSYQSGLFRVTASLKIDPAYIPEKVLADAEQKLRDEFSFENRSFGQPVHLSEVFTVLQQVTGVIAVNITALYRSNESSALNQHIAAAVPLPTRTQVLPAEILTLDSQPLNLGTFQ